MLLGGQDLGKFCPCQIFSKCLGQEVEPFAGFWLRTDWFSSGYNRHAIMPHTRARTHPYTLTPTLTHTDTCDLQGAVAKFDQPRLVCINRNKIAAICLPAIQLSPIAYTPFANMILLSSGA